MKAGAKGEPVSMPGPPPVGEHEPVRITENVQTLLVLHSILMSIEGLVEIATRLAAAGPAPSIVEKGGPKTSPPIPGRTPVLERGRR